MGKIKWTTLKINVEVEAEEASDAEIEKCAAEWEELHCKIEDYLAGLALNNHGWHFKIEQ